MLADKRKRTNNFFIKFLDSIERIFSGYLEVINLIYSFNKCLSN
jgi:hypothetical protein